MSLELEEEKILRNTLIDCNQFPEHYKCRYTYAKSKCNKLGLQKL